MKQTAALAEQAEPRARLARLDKDHFTAADPCCRSLELPEGLLLRYTAAQALYFYLRSGVDDGRIVTAVYASDSPYERQKALVGEARTPMFEPQADLTHLLKVEALVRAWVEFVKDAPPDRDFISFPLNRGVG
jgi:hypothetical protein